MRFMKISVIILALAISCLCYAQAQFARQSSFEDLDAILLKAGSIEAFLENPKLRKEYFENLNALVSVTSQVNENGFNTILSQLQKMAKKHPSTLTRLWETTRMGEDFAVQSEGISFGRELDSRAWKTYLDGHLEKLARDAKSINSREAAFRIVEELDTKVAKLEASLVGTTDRAKQKELALGLTKLRSEKKYIPALSFIAHQELSRSFMNRDLSADSILNLLSLWNRDIRQLLDDRGDALFRSRSMPAFLKSYVPSPAQLLKNKEIFPIATRNTLRGKTITQAKGHYATYDFKTPPRRFHAIFKGFFGGRECIGGSVCGYTTPTRWGNILLADTHLWFVYKNGLPTGYVMASPIHVADVSSIYASLDLKSDVLYARLLSNEDSNIESKTVLDRVLEKLDEQRLRHWKGFVLGHTGSISATSSHHESEAYFLGDHFPKGVGSEDKKMARILESFSVPSQYSNGIVVTDATVYDQSFLRKLATPSEVLERRQDTNLFEFKKALMSQYDEDDLKSFFRSRLRSVSGRNLILQFLEQEKSEYFWELALNSVLKENSPDYGKEMVNRIKSFDNIPKGMRASIEQFLVENKLVETPTSQKLADIIADSRALLEEQVEAGNQLRRYPDLDAASVKKIEKVFYKAELELQFALWDLIADSPHSNHAALAKFAFSWINSSDDKKSFYGSGFFRRLISYRRSEQWNEIHDSLKGDRSGRTILKQLQEMFPGLTQLPAGESCAESARALVVTVDSR